MATAALKAEIKRIRVWIEEQRARAAQGAQPANLLERLQADPAVLLTAAGLEPDPWQARVLRCTDPRILLLCSRQAGKSLCVSGLALHTALTQPGALVLLLSSSVRQSGELFRAKLLRLWRKLGEPLRARPSTQLELELANGSRVISLPENEEGIRGFSEVNLLVIDEAARVSDGLYRAVRPMLAVSQGRLVALSSARGQFGWFYDSWRGPENWLRVRITADMVPRITAEFLAEERRELGARWYAMEYECEFAGLTGAVFDPADVDAAMRADLAPVLLQEN